MFVWELIAHRLRAEGWSVWHQHQPGSGNDDFVVLAQRPGLSLRTHGPTLTEAFAEAARRAREGRSHARAEPGPHFGHATARVR